MSDIFTRSSTTTVREWVVPTREPWGACWNQVQLAIDQACEAWLIANKDQVMITAQDDRCLSVPDNAVRVKVGDDEIVVFFEQKVALSDIEPPARTATKRAAPPQRTPVISIEQPPDPGAASRPVITADWKADDVECPKPGDLKFNTPEDALKTINARRISTGKDFTSTLCRCGWYHLEEVVKNVAR